MSPEPKYTNAATHRSGVSTSVLCCDIIFAPRSLVPRVASVMNETKGSVSFDRVVLRFVVRRLFTFVGMGGGVGLVQFYLASVVVRGLRASPLCQVLL